MDSSKLYDAIIVGGGPAGATAALDLSRRGRAVLMLDREDRIKPCGGAIPPQAMTEFDIPDSILVAHVTSARMVSPTSREVDMPITGGFVGMVDRKTFDPWLRDRAEQAGATRVRGTYERITRDDGTAVVHFTTPDGAAASVRGKVVIGADGANSAVARQEIPCHKEMHYVFAYHEIVRSPEPGQQGYDGTRCDVYYQGRISPDFYGWIFPHGDTASIGVGTAHKGFSLRGAVAELRKDTGLDGAETLRKEGAPIPLKPLRKWDNGKDVVLAGDAAGVVAPASGEGIYYALTGGRLAAEAVDALLKTGDVRSLELARQRFMKAHGRVFFILGMLQKFWYSNDKRRERFVSMCRDPDVQHLTWQAYMYKRLVRAKPLAHARIFFKDLAHLLGLVSPSR
jgi:geranylgeranyl diphosphate/geranylgeranyl-bacteriochlorophyllide a reductase